MASDVEKLRRLRQSMGTYPWNLPGQTRHSAVIVQREEPEPEPVETDFVAKGSRIDPLKKKMISARTRQVTYQYLETKPEVLPYPYKVEGLYSLHNISVILRTITRALRAETFRMPLTIEPLFKRKCIDCGHQSDTIIDSCPKCQSLNIREPDRDEHMIMANLLDRCNFNKQGLTDVLKQMLDDLNIADDAWLLFSKDYEVAEDGTIISEQVREITRGRPEMINYVADANGRIGNKFWTCVEHREVLVDAWKRRNVSPASGREDLKGNFIVYHPSEKCPHCGRELHEVKAVITKFHAGGQVSKQPEWGLLDGEFVHISHYSPGMLYGLSPMLTVWRMARILWYMDRLEDDTYRDGFPPKGFLSIASRNMSAVREYMMKEFEKAEQRRSYIPKIMVETGESGRAVGEVNWVPITPSFQELENLTHRDWFMRRIAAFYGVSPIFMDDVGTSGGLNQEGLQLTVTRRAIEEFHTTYHKRVFPMLLEMIGVHDWTFKFPPVSEITRRLNVEDRQKNIEAMRVLKESFPQVWFRITDVERLDFETVGLEEASKQQPSLPSPMSGPPIPPKGRGPGIKPQDESSYEIGGSGFQGESVGMEAERNVPANPHEMMYDALQLDAFVKFDKRIDDLIKQGMSEVDASLTKDADVKQFAGVSKKVTEEIQEIIRRGVEEGETKEAIGAKIKNLVALEESRISTILNTERQAFINQGRELAYRKDDPKGEKLYKWTGPTKTACSICLAILDQIGAGVPLTELKSIIGGISKSNLGEHWLSRSWTPHPNCRHYLARV
jgi:predicted Zn-ribbon and HTH transcriptional regulator